MQMAYVNALYELLKEDPHVCSLLSDSGTDYDEMMFHEFPNQCFNFGIAEENKVAAASGMAAFGLVPFVYTTGAFLAYRSLEFIRDDVCLQNRNVKIVGMGSGLSWSTLGPSHHTTEDIGALRSLPNLTVLSPASPLEVKKCVRAAYEKKGPVYVRIGMSKEEEIYEQDYHFEIGKCYPLLEGSGFVIFTTGSIASNTLHAARKLAEDGLSVRLIHMPTLKPIDEAGILDALQGVKKAFTVEEHNIIGGLGSAVSEVMAQAGCGVPLARIGLNDCFATGYGTHAQVLAANGLDSVSIYQQIKKQIGGV